MHTIKLKISDKIYDKFTWLLSKFSKDEVEVIKEDETYNAAKIYLEKELNEINNGKASFHTIEELDKILERTIDPGEAEV